MPFCLDVGSGGTWTFLSVTYISCQSPTPSVAGGSREEASLSPLLPHLWLSKSSVSATSNIWFHSVAYPVKALLLPGLNLTHRLKPELLPHLETSRTIHSFFRKLLKTPLSSLQLPVFFICHRHKIPGVGLFCFSDFFERPHLAWQCWDLALSCP